MKRSTKAFLLTAKGLILLLTLSITSLAESLIAQVPSPPPAPPPAASMSDNIQKLHNSDLENAYTIKDLNNDYALIKTGNTYSIINKISQEKSEYTFESIDRFYPVSGHTLSVYDPNEIYFWIKKGDLKGMINNNGELLIPIEYQSLLTYIAKKNGKYGVVDLDNNIIIPFIYENLNSTLKDSTIIAELNSKVGVIDRNGETLIDFNYAYVDRLSEHHYSFSTSEIDRRNWENTYGVIDEKGQIILNEEYKKFEHLIDDFILFETKENLYGVFHEELGITIQAIYEEMKSTTLGSIVIAKKNNKFGLLGVSGKALIDLEFDSIETNLFMFKATQNGKYGFLGVNPSGDFANLTGCVYDELDDFSISSRIACVINGKKSYIEYSFTTEKFIQSR